MLDFNLEYYRAFYYVAQLGSITRAANALFLGQPTLTRSIHLLEESLDCQLFIRTAKGMTPILDASGLVVTPIKQFHDIIVAGEAFRKSFAGNLISITELLDQPLATVEKGTSAFSNTERWFQEQGSPLVPHFSVRAFSTVFQLVKSHLAIGILPDMYVENELQSGEFFQIETEQKPPSREIVLIYKSEKNLSFLSKQFIEFLKGNEL